MKIACIGTGFVGVVTSSVFAKLGHEVVGLDIDEKKIRSLSESRTPFYEPGLEDLLIESIKSGKLNFTTSYEEAITAAEVILITVGTPPAPDGQADTNYVEAALQSLSPHLKEGAIIVIKSTVPPGFNNNAHKIISSITKINFSIASVPEFLKEGTAVQDTLVQDRILIGTDDKNTVEILSKLHQPLTKVIHIMKPESAQMAKYASNTYLAQRINFINQIADLCEKNGADIEEVIVGMGGDRRIGEHYWYPGLGYGGSCFPKDVKEIAAYSKAVGEGDSIFVKIDQLNEDRIPKMMQKFDSLVGGFKNKVVAILGLSFKPNTNDTRVAPSLRVIPWLLENGAMVRATDPKAIEEAKKLLPQEVEYFEDVYKTIEGSHVTILLVEWDEYKGLNLPNVAKLMQDPKYFIDTRNQYLKKSVEQEGMKYKGVGK